MKLFNTTKEIGTSDPRNYAEIEEHLSHFEDFVDEVSRHPENKELVLKYDTNDDPVPGLDTERFEGFERHDGNSMEDFPSDQLEGAVKQAALNYRDEDLWTFLEYTTDSIDEDRNYEHGEWTFYAGGDERAKNAEEFLDVDITPTLYGRAKSITDRLR